MSEYRTKVFKGATRPAMMLGVPIIPAVAVCGSFILISMWTLAISKSLAYCVAILAVGVAVMLVLRLVSKSDDHRLNQIMLWLSTIVYRRNKSFWKAHSMSPVDYEQRRRSFDD